MGKGRGGKKVKEERNNRRHVKEERGEGRTKIKIVEKTLKDNKDVNDAFSWSSLIWT